MLTFNLIQHLTYLLQQLEPYLYPQSTPMMEGMIFEIIRRLDLDSVDIHVAVVYLQRLLICLPGTPSALHCYTKPLVFLATLRVAHKFVCDFSYFRMHLFTTLSRAFYITTQDFNSCEFFLMKALDWDLNVSELQFSLLKASFEETGSFYPKGDGFGVANPVSRYIFLLLLFFFDCVIYSMSDWLPLYVDHRNLTYCNKVFSNKLPNST
ncbi:Dimethlysulfonioproprionate lyase DddW [Fusarium oxysporum f. sp. albedinis]|nr:Dimethlysulfonioproprionate lyase DddW [Fusarium oxysporum f. sp. albedinis]